ncbi:MAG: phosphoribosylglycinamide formyltransferase [bacterium]|nr:phosphoribosylglycinamide formyltransferase [bacterium]
MRKMKVAFFASGRGSNAERLLEGMRDGWICGEPVLLVTDRECDAEALSFEYEFPSVRLIPKQFSTREAWNQAVLDTVTKSGAEFIALCGYLRLFPPALCNRFPHRIVNIHPGPLPQFGGNGMWGHHVHEAVLASGVKWSGPTVHYVNEEYDKGAIIDHLPVPVLTDDTPETLAARVLCAEHRLYPLCVAKLLVNLIR